MNELEKRMFDLAKDLQLMNVATITEDGKPWVRYVVGKADADLVFRFCTDLRTSKVRQLRNNPNVHLTLGATNMMTAKDWLQVQGVAEISTAKDERDAFWFEFLKARFKGPDDPHYSVVIVRPTRIEWGSMRSSEKEVWLPSK
jgi:general stress protein 26